MSSAEIKTDHTLDILRRNQRSLIYGLFFAALALLLLAWWIYTKYWETAPWVSWAVAGLGVLALAVGVLQTLQFHALKKQKAEAQEAQLPQKRSQGTLVIIAVSGILLLLMLVLLFQVQDNRLTAYPEVSTGVLLALMGLLAGYLASAGGTEKRINQQKILDSLVQNRRQFTMTCLAIGGALLIVGIFVLYNNRRDMWAAFPLGGGGILLGLVLLGVGLWDMLATTKELTVANMRVLVLVAGGSSGLVIALMAALQAWIWRDMVAGGIAVWQGEQAWKLWQCIWLELLGLGLMFGSLYLSQADIRFNPILRRLLYGYNAIFTGLLVLAMLVVLNIVVYASFPFTFNWTASQGFYALSEKSKNILRKMQKPTTVFMLMPSGSASYTDVKNLLENAQAYSNLLEVKEISPDRQPNEYNKLKARFPKLKEVSQSFQQAAGRGLLIAYGFSENNPPPPDERIPHAFIPTSDLSEEGFDPPTGKDQPKKRLEFKGENLLMTQLSFMIGGEQKPIVYFTQSNREVNVKNKANFIEAGGMIADKLESANYQVRQLFWGAPDQEKKGEGVGFSKKIDKDAHKVPADAKVVVIAWPKDTFDKGVIDALEEYMKKGGKMVVMSSAVDPKYRPIKTGLEPLLKKFAVDMGENYILHDTPELIMAPYTISIARPVEKGNPIAAAFARYEFYFDAARSVKPMQGVTGFTAESIFDIPIKQREYVWAESDMSKLLPHPDHYVIELKKSNKIFQKASNEPVSVAVAVTDRDQQPRLVVFGDGQMASNKTLERSVPYHDLVVSSIAWFERPEDIGIAPKITHMYTFPVGTGVSRTRMVLLPMGLMALGLIGLGLGVWVVRRP